jgi:hypothetical protein
MPRPTASGRESGHAQYPENTPVDGGVYVTLCWLTDIMGQERKNREKVTWFPAVPRIGDKVYAERMWESPMEVADVHWDAEPARIYVYLE